jgi:hypothetical protein
VLLWAGKACINQNKGIYMASEYFHWSKEGNIILKRKSYVQQESFKPIGFWFDCNKTWKDWCIHEEFYLKNLQYCYNVILLETHRILHLSSAESIETFTTTYKVPYQSSSYINWQLVATDYDGIIVNPYFYGGLRWKYGWYHTWDVPSGCIWDTKIIQLERSEYESSLSED